jgi:hypothetical protein
MTKTNFPVPVFRDLQHEQQMTADIEKTRRALQELVDTWHSLDIAPLNDLPALLQDPRAYYDRTLAATIELPKQTGKYQVSKQQYIRSLDTPDPAPLVKLAAEVRRAPHAKNPLLWTLAGDQVQTNPDAAQQLINAATVYARTPEQLQLITDLQTTAELLNSLDDRMNNELLHQNAHAHAFLTRLFDIVTETYPGPARLRLSPDRLLQVLNQYLPQ